MKRETAKWLLDVQRACQEIIQFSDGESLDSLLANRGLQLILHKLEGSVGEALYQLSKTDPATAARIPNLRRFVGLRNQITHGYDTVDYAIIWQVASQHIVPLQEVVEAPPLKHPRP